MILTGSGLVFRPSPPSEAVRDGDSAELECCSALREASVWTSVGLALEMEMVSRKG